MPNELIERVAKAIAKHQAQEFLFNEEVCRTLSAVKVQAHKGHLFEASRAAIEAMREPTQDMLSDGQINLGAGGELDNENLKEVWGLMIDAALEG